MYAPSFAIVNNVGYIATELPNRPDCKDFVQMSREGSTSTKAYYFRPFYVNRALRWLKLNNPLYKDIPITILDEDPNNRDHEEPLMDITLDITDADGDALHAHYTDKTNNPSSVNGVVDNDSSDTLLFYTPGPLPSEVDVARERVSNQHSMFTIPRLDDDGSEKAHPYTTDSFYEKAFPCLFPFGPAAEEHGLKNEDHFMKLLLSRRGDRRFQRDARFYFTVYTYRMRKNVGGLAMNVAKADVHSAALNNIVDDVNYCIDGKEICDLFRKGNDQAIKTVLNKLVTYSSTIKGTLPYIKLMRKKLFSLISSPAVLEDGTMRVFGTNSWNDLRGREFFKLVCQCSDEEFLDMDEAKRVACVREHPAISCRLFEARKKAMFDHIYYGEAQPFGKITDHWSRIEFQGIHVHYVKRISIFNIVHHTE